MVCPDFVAFSRVDYSGFISLGKPVEGDQCRCHFKIRDFPSLKTGRILISVICHISGDGNKLTKFDFSGGGNVLFGFGDMPAYGKKDRLGGVSCHTPGDGFYPISLHYDCDGEIDLIMIQMIQK